MATLGCLVFEAQVRPRRPDHAGAPTVIRQTDADLDNSIPVTRTSWQRGKRLYFFVEDRPYLIENAGRRGHVQRVRLPARGCLRYKKHIDSLLFDTRFYPGEFPVCPSRAAD